MDEAAETSVRPARFDTGSRYVSESRAGSRMSWASSRACGGATGGRLDAVGSALSLASLPNSPEIELIAFTSVYAMPFGVDDALLHGSS